uniref:cytochrome c biogenesis protein transmembrane region n=1 Tax=Goniotrichopsis reniformis TaxID=468933 RepID=UPI001FCD6C75|nr:cytochrome c biogenesis protein transmembrane region [Goniotrichopsis reniformis]UNJ14803.1 cytochrome c biogenesis protein transmembrane region [Goniotrichopsis reniformis]
MLNSIFTLQNFAFQIPFIFIIGFINSLNPCSIGIFPIVMYSIQDKIWSIELKKWLIFTLGLLTAFLIVFLINLEIYHYLNTIVASKSAISFTFNAIFFLSLGSISLEIIPSGIYFNSIQWLDKIKLKNSLLILYITGIAIGLTLSSCTTPILFTFFNWLNNQPSIPKQFFCGTVYILGYSSAFLIMLNIFKDLINIIQSKYWNNLFNTNIGILLVAYGIYNSLCIITSII